MKKQYSTPTIQSVAMPAATIMTSLSINGTEGGEARASRFYGAFPWDEEEDTEDVCEI